MQAVAFGMIPFLKHVRKCSFREAFDLNEIEGVVIEACVAITL